MKNSMGAILKVEEAEEEAREVLEKANLKSAQIIADAYSKAQQIAAEAQQKAEEARRIGLEKDAARLEGIKEKLKKDAEARAEKIKKTKVSVRAMESVAKKAAELLLGA